MILNCGINPFIDVVGCKLVFCLPLKLWVADENGKGHCCTVHEVIGGDLCSFFVADHFAVRFYTAQECRAKAAVMGSALWGRDGVTICVREAITERWPCDGPFDASFIIGQVCFSVKRGGG